MKQNKNRRLHRLLLKNCNSEGQVCNLPEDLMHYASRVLRLREGETLRIWNGQNSEYLATIHYVSKKLAQVHVSEQLPVMNTELNWPFHVIQALPEGDKMDWILEKCTELGVNGFHPVLAQRSVVKLEGDRAIKRQLHWERVILSASLQSERGHLPQVETVKSLKLTLEYIKHTWPNALLLWFTPGSPLSFRKSIESVSIKVPLFICVGPEGGWTSEETELAVQMGAISVNFSRRVLRTETFAMACVAQLTALFNLESN
jgi:16S rRNA (uracil1498-N3)-methyltransferase